MKNLISTIIVIIFAATFSFAQSGSKPVKLIDGASGRSSEEKTVTVNLYGGILQAAEVTGMSDNSHWIKKGQFVNRTNTVVIDFKEKLYVNNTPVIDQVDARNGYIVFFSEGFDYALIYLADEKGNLNSDELYVNLK